MSQDHIKEPKFFHRDVQAKIKEISCLVASTGSVREALIVTVRPYAGQLPEGMTCESVVSDIQGMARTFCTAQAGTLTKEDVKRQLKQDIAGMDREKAFLYIATLATSFTACDQHFSGTAMPTPEQFQQALQTMVKDLGEEDLDKWIDDLAHVVAGDSLKSSILAAGDADLIELVRGGDLSAKKCGAFAADFARNGIEKEDQYVICACACYVAILDGKIEGVSARNLDSRVVAVLMSAGLEKASILKRLRRGEIDLSLARDFLQKIAVVVKWLLIKLFKLGIVAASGLVAIAAINFFSLFSCIGAIVLSLGLIVGVWMAMDQEEKLEKLVEELGDLLTCVAKDVADLGRAIWKKVTDFCTNAACERMPA